MWYAFADLTNQCFSERRPAPGRMSRTFKSKLSSHPAVSVVPIHLVRSLQVHLQTEWHRLRFCSSNTPLISSIRCGQYCTKPKSGYICSLERYRICSGNCHTGDDAIVHPTSTASLVYVSPRVMAKFRRLPAKCLPLYNFLAVRYTARRSKISCPGPLHILPTGSNHTHP